MEHSEPRGYNIDACHPDKERCFYCGAHIIEVSEGRDTGKLESYVHAHDLSNEEIIDVYYHMECFDIVTSSDRGGPNEGCDEFEGDTIRAFNQRMQRDRGCIEYW